MTPAEIAVALVQACARHASNEVVETIANRGIDGDGDKAGTVLRLLAEMSVAAHHAGVAGMSLEAFLEIVARRAAYL